MTFCSPEDVQFWQVILIILRDYNNIRDVSEFKVKFKSLENKFFMLVLCYAPTMSSFRGGRAGIPRAIDIFLNLFVNSLHCENVNVCQMPPKNNFSTLCTEQEPACRKPLGPGYQNRGKRYFYELDWSSEFRIKIQRKYIWPKAFSCTITRLLAFNCLYYITTTAEVYGMFQHGYFVFHIHHLVYWLFDSM